MVSGDRYARAQHRSDGRHHEAGTEKNSLQNRQVSHE